jgi:hypothetical protein
VAATADPHEGRRRPPRPTLRWAVWAVAALWLLPGLTIPPAARAANERLVLAFYYAWFDANTWRSGTLPDLPQTLYNSDDREAMARHVEQAQAAGIDALILHWYGTGNRTEKNLKAFLEVAASKGSRVAVDFGLDSPVVSGVASVTGHLRHLHTVHMAHPAYLRYQGRPVLFFYNVADLPAATWRNVRDQVDPDRKALWIAEGTNVGYLSVFDGHHLYSITWPNRIPPAQTLSRWGDRVRSYNREQGTAKLWVATVMPGYDDRKIRPRAGFARSREGGDYYRACWQAAIASRPDWVVITSFNEWPEGSYIEPSQAYGSLYLDLTREWSARYKAADFAAGAALPPSAPTPAPPASPSPAVAPGPTPTAAAGSRPTGYCLPSPWPDGGELFWELCWPAGWRLRPDLPRPY